MEGAYGMRSLNKLDPSQVENVFRVNPEGQPFRDDTQEIYFTSIPSASEVFSAAPGELGDITRLIPSINQHNTEELQVG